MGEDDLSTADAAPQTIESEAAALVEQLSHGAFWPSRRRLSNRCWWNRSAKSIAKLVRPFASPIQ
jgi:hypothetical protein